MHSIQKKLCIQTSVGVHSHTLHLLYGTVYFPMSYGAILRMPLRKTRDPPALPPVLRRLTDLSPSASEALH